MDTFEEKPIVSIIMPSYNSEGTILKAIYSVINQTYTSWELIVVDDCSIDDTITIASSIEDSRIKIITLPNNSGSPAIPRNIGIKQSRGQFIAFLDSDDLWKLNKLEIQLKEMEENNSSFSCSSYNLLKDGDVVKSYYPPKWASYDMLLKNNSVGCLTSVIKKELLNDVSFPQCGHEDFAMWLNILRTNNIEILGVQSILADYNLLPGSVSSSKYKMVPYFWNIYRNKENLSIFSSLYYCICYFLTFYYSNINDSLGI